MLRGLVAHDPEVLAILVVTIGHLPDVRPEKRVSLGSGPDSFVDLQEDYGILCYRLQHGHLLHGCCTKTLLHPRLIKRRSKLTFPVHAKVGTEEVVAHLTTSDSFDCVHSFQWVNHHAGNFLFAFVHPHFPVLGKELPTTLTNS